VLSLFIRLRIGILPLRERIVKPGENGRKVKELGEVLLRNWNFSGILLPGCAEAAAVVRYFYTPT
jgi:hypothetical protein